MKKLLFVVLFLASGFAFGSDCASNEKSVFEYTENTQTVYFPLDRDIISVTLTSTKKMRGSASIIQADLTKYKLFDINWPNYGTVQLDLSKLRHLSKTGVDYVISSKKPMNVTLVWCERK